MLSKLNLQRTLRFVQPQIAALSSSSRQQVNASLRIYKTRCVLDTSFVAPVFLDGATSTSMRRMGGAMLKFAAEHPDSTPEKRSYDYEKQQVFMLSPFEIGQLLALAEDGSGEARFFHDPNMKSDQSGSITKSLVVKRSSGDKKGWSFALDVSENGSKSGNFYMFLTDGEFRTVRSVFEHMLPVCTCLGSIFFSHVRCIARSTLLEFRRPTAPALMPLVKSEIHAKTSQHSPTTSDDDFSFFILGVL